MNDPTNDPTTDQLGQDLGDPSATSTTPASTPQPAAAFFPTNRIGTLVASGCILVAVIWLLVSSFTTATDRELLAASVCARTELEGHFVTANPVVVTRRDLARVEGNCKRREVALHQASVLSSVEVTTGDAK